MTKLIKTNSEIVNLFLKAVYINEMWREEFYGVSEHPEIPSRVGREISKPRE